jgi:hypothetical protein
MIKNVLSKEFDKATLIRKDLLMFSVLQRLSRNIELLVTLLKSLLFLVPTDKGIVKFNCSPEGLYYMVMD